MKHRINLFTLLLSLSLASADLPLLGAKTAEEVQPLLIGATVPSAQVATQTGESVDIKDVLKGKSSVVIFYRGGWCPYCNTQLAELASIENDFKAMGYQIIAISPDTPDKLNSTGQKNSLGYQLISDSDYNAMDAFGIGFDHPRRGKLPVPSVFLVRPDLKISFQYVNPNYRERISSKLLLAAADS